MATASVTGVAQYTSQNLSAHAHTHKPLHSTDSLTHARPFHGRLDFTEARDSEWQWHQLDHMQVCTSLQTDIHASTPPLSLFTGQMPFLLPNQQRQSTEGNYSHTREPKCRLVFKNFKYF